MARGRVAVEEIRSPVEDLFVAVGVPREHAAVIADVHLDAELRGEQSHGLRLLPTHVARIEAGSVRPVPLVTELRNDRATALLDAHFSIGQVVAVRAMRLAIAKAQEHGVGLVGVRNAESFTSAKYYPLLAVQAGMIGICYANSRPMMPPPGGVASRVGNNPMAVAAPADREYPFVVDFANTVAKEKIRQALAERRAIPSTWALGRDGAPTTDPAEALASGVLMPFGGHKAFGLGLANEVLTSVLCGGPLFTGSGTGFTPYDNPYNGSQLFQAVDISMFGDPLEFRRGVDAMIRAIRDTPRAAGCEAIHAPGERGFREMERRMRMGIPVVPGVFRELTSLGEKLRVESWQRFEAFVA